MKSRTALHGAILVACLTVASCGGGNDGTAEQLSSSGAEPMQSSTPQGPSVPPSVVPANPATITPQASMFREVPAPSEPPPTRYPGVRVHAGDFFTYDVVTCEGPASATPVTSRRTTQIRRVDADGRQVVVHQYGTYAQTLVIDPTGALERLVSADTLVASSGVSECNYSSPLPLTPLADSVVGASRSANAGSACSAGRTLLSVSEYSTTLYNTGVGVLKTKLGTFNVFHYEKRLDTTERLSGMVSSHRVESCSVDAKTGVPVHCRAIVTDSVVSGAITVTEATLVAFRFGDKIWDSTQ